MRIVSLLPSATEMVCALGLREQLVGVTHACDHPASVRDLPVVTRTVIPKGATSGEIDALVRDRQSTRTALYTLDTDVLDALRPDLIVTQGLCDVCAVAEDEVRAAACALPGRPRVVNLEPGTLGDVFGSIREVGRAAGVGSQADEVVAALAARVAAVTERSQLVASRPRVAVLEWLDPPFCSGHWSPELVRLAGGVEGLGRQGVPSRTLAWEEVWAWAPEVIVLACCGFTAERTVQDLALVRDLDGWADLPAVRAGRVHVVSGSDYLSRPGPRLVDSLEIVAHVLHPELHPLPPGLPAPLRMPGMPRAAGAQS
jgi:iron complex transport system substrate-binding protein